MSGKEKFNGGTSGIGWYQYIGDDGKVYRVEYVYIFEYLYVNLYDIFSKFHNFNSYESGAQGFIPKVSECFNLTLYFS